MKNNYFIFFKKKLNFKDKIIYEEINNCNVYGEYGIGKESTNFFYKNQCNNNNDILIKYIDLGVVSDWGYPKNYKKHYNFKLYTDYLWEINESYDLIYIDGRFRVCCFLTCLKYASQNTRIVFDDYVHREHYHYIEKYIKPVRKKNGQALFVIPSKNEINFIDLDADIENFRFVFQ